MFRHPSRIQDVEALKRGRWRISAHAKVQLSWEASWCWTLEAMRRTSTYFAEPLVLLLPSFPVRTSNSRTSNHHPNKPSPLPSFRGFSFRSTKSRDDIYRLHAKLAKPLVLKDTLSSLLESLVEDSATLIRPLHYSNLR